jgi:threonine synthase
VETAHPVKFYDVVEPLIDEPIPLPASVAEIINRKKEAIQIDARYEMLKEYLIK